MQGTRRFSLESARSAAAEDRIALWVGEFLASRGSDNATLAAALAQDEHWWLGPIQVPLDALIRLAGPEDEALVPIEPEEWEEDVSTLEGSIEQGWEPPPLLAEFQDGRLLLQDGNHRYEALLRAGETEAWVIVWFDDPTERDRYQAGRRDE
jgi:ParB-like nuclease domain